MNADIDDKKAPFEKWRAELEEAITKNLTEQALLRGFIPKDHVVICTVIARRGHIAERLFYLASALTPDNWAMLLEHTWSPLTLRTLKEIRDSSNGKIDTIRPKVAKEVNQLLRAKGSHIRLHCDMVYLGKKGMQFTTIDTQKAQKWPDDSPAFCATLRFMPV